MTSEAQIMTPEVRPDPAVEEEARIYVASQWKLTWWRFRKHKVAMVSGAIVIFVYLVALFAEFLAPFPTDMYNSRYTFAPPQRVHLFLSTEEGLKFQPHVNGFDVEIDPVALRRTFVVDPDVVYPIGFFVEGFSYRLLGLFETNIHLIGPINPADPMYLLGADRLGRDVFSRLVFGTRISMSIGLVGVFLSFILGILLGGVSGLYGGMADNLIQRLIEFIRSVPTIPLWLGLAAALPMTWSPLAVYFGITVILSLIGWTDLARVVRGRFLTLRTEDFVMAARLDGASQQRIIWKYMVPSFTSHIIASLTLAIPGMILAETALSFLGLGLRPPIVSWGVLLQEAQNIRAVATAPWLLTPGIAVVVTVLALNFLGDGLRDAADPYSRG
ncbi:MAG: peptide ABC transporter permease [Chloroflexota bacterium]|nr:ABC transporter permease [Caldilinea sp.]GIK75259.1 MAG: peptide ABC transporter permease [Chloroflexota bacterium]